MCECDVYASAYACVREMWLVLKQSLGIADSVALVAQIHDELLFEVNTASRFGNLETVSDKVRSIMEGEALEFSLPTACSVTGSAACLLSLKTHFALQHHSALPHSAWLLSSIPHPTTSADVLLLPMVHCSPSLSKNASCSTQAPHSACLLSSIPHHVTFNDVLLTLTLHSLHPALPHPLFLSSSLALSLPWHIGRCPNRYCLHALSDARFLLLVVPVCSCSFFVPHSPTCSYPSRSLLHGKLYCSLSLLEDRFLLYLSVRWLSNSLAQPVLFQAARHLRIAHSSRCAAACVCHGVWHVLALDPACYRRNCTALLHCHERNAARRGGCLLGPPPPSPRLSRVCGSAKAAPLLCQRHRARR